MAAHDPVLLLEKHPPIITAAIPSTQPQHRARLRLLWSPIAIVITTIIMTMMMTDNANSGAGPGDSKEVKVDRVTAPPSESKSWMPPKVSSIGECTDHAPSAQCVGYYGVIQLD